MTTVNQLTRQERKDKIIYRSCYGVAILIAIIMVVLYATGIQTEVHWLIGFFPLGTIGFLELLAWSWFSALD
ncbi:MAG: hypothetical protein LBG64_01785 [Pseudomonadales bacterium]|jgi:hypothetical protein|nr:hypothetical protein [Pseudomonadales bacterium]